MGLESPDLAPELRLGQSVSVSGVCLTVTEISGKSFGVEMTEETLNRTRFKSLSVGDKVNLERALSLSSRLDGHIVTGHVDGAASLILKRSGLRSAWMTFSIPEKLAKYAVPKGSVALDGVSLTVAEIRGCELSVAFIPSTLKNTTFGSLSVGDEVNLEVDVLGRYVEKILRPSPGSGPALLTEERLHDLGW